MEHLKKLLKYFGKERSYIKDLFLIVMLTRLLFLEDNTLLILAEIISGVVIIFHPLNENHEIE